MIRFSNKVADMNKNHLWADLGGTLNLVLLMLTLAQDKP